MGQVREPAAGAGWKLAALFLFLCLILTGCSLRQMGVEAGLVENPYYQEGDTEWDHGGIEEYYFDHLPSEYNEIYRELYSRLSAGEDSGDLYARTDADHFWKAYYSVLADHPELFWLDSGAEIQSNAFSGTVVHYSASTVVEPEKREEELTPPPDALTPPPEGKTPSKPYSRTARILALLGVAFMVFLTIMYAYSFASGKVMLW